MLTCLAPATGPTSQDCHLGAELVAQRWGAPLPCDSGRAGAGVVRNGAPSFPSSLIFFFFSEMCLQMF